jgi:hypothetical protein
MIHQSVLLVFLCFVGGTVLAQNDQQHQKHDLEQLLSAAVPFAEQMLMNHGEFFPYGSSMNGDGKISAVGGYTGGEHPKSTERIGLLRAGFRREAIARALTKIVFVPRFKVPAESMFRRWPKH